MSQLYKAPDVLIDAVGLCVARGNKINLKIIGDGKFRSNLEKRVSRLGLNDSIIFLGQLPAGKLVRNELLKSDLFILPSRTEGLPRAMIEAMACGLPCIGTNVGGIPELLPEEDLVPPGRVQALADKIGEVLDNPERMRTMAARNLEKANEFRKDILDERRRVFYQQLRDETKARLR
jgi:glycosyltransferase involved in cell wall biosynthesis